MLQNATSHATTTVVSITNRLINLKQDTLLLKYSF